MEAALAGGGCHLIGIGRPVTVKPAFPKEVLLSPDVRDEDAGLFIDKIRPAWFLRMTGVHALGAAADSVSLGPSHLVTPDFISFLYCDRILLRGGGGGGFIF